MSRLFDGSPHTIGVMRTEADRAVASFPFEPRLRQARAELRREIRAYEAAVAR